MKKVIILFAAIACALCSCNKDKDPGRVYGIVTVERTNELVVSTTIELCDLQGNVLDKTTTDDNARYEFNNVTKGLYQLKVSGEKNPYAHVFKILPGENKQADVIVHSIDLNGDIAWIELPSIGIAVQRSDIGEGNWQSVNALCENSIAGNFNDWRLPTNEELTTIYLNRASIGGFYTGGADSGHFGDTYYWTNTIVPGTNLYYCIDFESGERLYYTNITARGRCVRTL